MTEPTYLRAAVEDWKAERISMFQLLKSSFGSPLRMVSYRRASRAIYGEANRTKVEKCDLRTDRIMEILRECQESR